MTSTQLSGKSLNEAVRDIGLKRGKMELLTSLLGYQSLKSHSDRQKRNLDAEDRAGRVALWGDSDAIPETGGSDVGDTILGDVNHPAPVVVQKAAGFLAPLTMAVLGASIPGAAIGGYALNQYFGKDNPAPSIVSEDESVRISLPDPDFDMEPRVIIE